MAQPVSPGSLLLFEDFSVGQVFELASHRVSSEEIIAFGRTWDPQPFHVDEVAAEDSPFGGLIASGWHTVSIFMRMSVDGFLSKTASMGSPGVDEVRWWHPVRPGDTLTGRLTIVEARPSATKPHRGTLHTLSELFNQDDRRVMSLTGRSMVARRTSAND